MNEKDTLDMVHSIVDYWVSFLRDPNSFIPDNGDPSKQGAMFTANTTLKKCLKYTEEEIINFEKKLIESLSKKRPQFLEVDYTPCNFLQTIILDTLTSSQDMGSIFPVKTDMFIRWDVGEVTVSQGYQAPDKVIHQYYAISLEKLWGIILTWKKENYPDTPNAMGCEKALERCYKGQYPVEIARQYCAQIYSTN